MGAALTASSAGCLLLFPLVGCGRFYDVWGRAGSYPTCYAAGKDCGRAVPGLCWFLAPVGCWCRCTVSAVRTVCCEVSVCPDTAHSTDSTADVPDFKEIFNWHGSRPVGHPLRVRYPFRYGPSVLPDGDIAGIGELLLNFHATVVCLQIRVSAIIAAGLGLHESFFEQMLFDGAHLTRAIHYPAMELAPGDSAEHADINLITALPRATAPGLQIRVGDGWVDAAPPDGAAIINTGLMLERLTNGMVPPGFHRVVAGPGQQGGRCSVVQFAHPEPCTVLAPVPTSVTPENPLRFPTISAADALSKVTWEINMMDTVRPPTDRSVEVPARGVCNVAGSGS